MPLSACARRPRTTAAAMALVVVLTFGPAAHSQQPPAGPPTGWSGSLQAAGLHQFETDMDNGGGFSVNRSFAQGRLGYNDPHRSLSLSLGYGRDAYDFSGRRGLAGLRPWQDVDTVQLGAFYRHGPGDRWSVFAAPSVRVTAETGADADRALTGGGFVGAAYRFGPHLTLGPGVGAISQLEDGVQVIPVLIIDWQITERVSLSTGRGLAATLGPGLMLGYRANDRWNLGIGGRYERLRFRLDDDGVAPGGIGDDRAFPLFAGITYRAGGNFAVNFIGGVELGGEVRLEDENGNEIVEEVHDPTGFLGVTVNWRF